MTIIPEKLDILTVICNSLGFELKYVLLKEMFADVGEGNNISILFRSTCLMRARAVQEIYQRGKHRCIDALTFPNNLQRVIRQNNKNCGIYHF